MASTRGVTPYSISLVTHIICSDAPCGCHTRGIVLHINVHRIFNSARHEAQYGIAGFAADSDSGCGKTAKSAVVQ